MSRFSRRQALEIALAAPALLIQGHSALADGLVDLELVLAIDGSGSTGPDDGNDFKLQVQGHSEAFRDPQVIHEIEMLRTRGGIGSIAVAALVWSDIIREPPESGQKFGHYVCVPWMRVTNAADAIRFSDTLLKSCVPLYGGTSMQLAIEWSFQLLDASPFVAPRQVIDVSTDEATSVGHLEKARNHAINRGVDINGIALEPDVPKDGGVAMPQSIHQYLLRHVVTPGGFALRASAAVYTEVLLRKFVSEISGMV